MTIPLILYKKHNTRSQHQGGLFSKSILKCQSSYNSLLIKARHGRFCLFNVGEGGVKK